MKTMKFQHKGMFFEKKLTSSSVCAKLEAAMFCLITVHDNSLSCLRANFDFLTQVTVSSDDEMS